MQKFLLIGNLGCDPEVKYSQQGTAIAQFSIATTERWKDKGGELQEHTEWFAVKTFGRRAEIVGENLHKGTRIYLEGRTNDLDSCVPLFLRVLSNDLIKRHSKQIVSCAADTFVNTGRRSVPNLKVVTSAGWRLYAQVDCWTLGRFSFPIRPDLPEVDMWEDRPKLRPRDARFKDLFHCLLFVFTTACSVLPLSWA